MSLFHAITDRPWLITDGALQTVLDVAARVQADPDAAQALQQERHEALAVKGGTPLAETRYTTVRDGVAVIEVIGPVVRYANIMTAYSGGTSTGLLAQDIQTALDSPNVRAILVAFDSPGGEATGVHELAQQIYQARGQKPLVAYVGGMAASAAYWLASACDEIVVDATAELGSIGAVLALPNPAARSSREIEIVSSQSPKKRPDVTTESGKAAYQARVDALAAVFVADVARNRGVSEETVLSDFGQGGVFAGQQAIDAGLADRLGSFEGTLAQLSKQTQPSPFRRAAMAAEEQTMKLTEFFRSAFRAAEEAGIPLEPDEGAEAAALGIDAAPSVSAEAIAELDALRAKIAAFETEQAQAAQQALDDAAARFAADQVDAKRIFPAEQTSLSALHRALAADDAKDSGARIAALESFLSARPAHQVADEQIASAAHVLPLPHVEADAGDDAAKREETRKRRLGQTPEGRAVLAKEQAAA